MLLPSIEKLKVFENIAFIMSKHADPVNVPDNPDDFLEQFNTFSIYEILPQLIELWELNTATNDSYDGWTEVAEQSDFDAF